MAQFYTRQLSIDIVAPCGVANTIFYGYRSNFYTLSGQRYHAANNTQILYGWQTLGLLGTYPQGNTVAIIDAEEMFEPSLMGSPYDLLGSKFTPEYDDGTYYVGTTYTDAQNITTFKNIGGYLPSSFSVNTATGEAISNNNAGGAQWTSGVSNQTAALVYYSNTASFIPVRGADDTTVRFVPRTISIYGFRTNSGSTSTFTNSHSEYVFGDTTAVSYTYATPYVITTSNQQNFFPSITSTAYTSVTAVDAQSNVEVSDSMFYGMPTSIVRYQGGSTGSPGAGQYIDGAAVYNQTAGASENGARVFLQRSADYTFYLYFNSVYAGIQGVDTSTSTNVRLSLKTFNNTSSAYTTLLNLKKGLGGMIIPSQPTVDDGTNYNFYFIEFEGADTAAQTLSIYQPSLNIVNGTVTKGNEYTLTMTSGEQAQIYADQGYNNTYEGVYNNSGFRRQTFNRIWYSDGTDGTRRLHMGVYNTNGLGFVTTANSFDNPASRGKLFKIYSWELDDDLETATYLGAVDMSAFCPRYFCPIQTDWQTVYCGSAIQNDFVITLNNSTGLYQYQSTMPYKAARLFKDKDGRWATQVVDFSTSSGTLYNNYIDILTADIGQTLEITASNTSFVYAGNTITSNVVVNVYDYLGNRLEKDVTLTIVGATATPGITFDDGSYATTITTSNSASTNVGIRVISSASAKILGTVTESA